MKRSTCFLVMSFVVLNTAFCQTHFFSITDQKIELLDNSYHVTKVIDQRADKSNIGWTQKGMSNKKVNANFANSAEREIGNFLKENLNTNGESILVVVNSLKISEKTGFSKERGLCELELDFLLENESGFYRIMQTSQTSEVSGMDVTKKHPENIANAFKLCFDELAKVDLSNTANFQKLSSQKEIDPDVLDSKNYDFPIFNEVIKTGIYSSYNELKNNTPSNTDEFVIEKKLRTNEPWAGSNEIIPKFKERNRKIKKVWAIADQGQVYVYHQKEFFPLIIEKNKLYFYGFGIPDFGTVSTGAVIGGLIGAGIASGIENSNAKKQKVKYILDPNTGAEMEVLLETEVK